MNLRSIAARTVVAGATSALAAGALVGVTATGANAATVSNTYTCSNTALGFTFDQAISVTGELPVPQYWAGAAVPEKLLNISVDATLDPAVAAGLSGAGVTKARSDDFSIALSTTKVPVPIAGDIASEGGTTTWKATGANKPFMTPDPGQANGLLPQAFTLIGESAALGDVPLSCTLKTGETAQTLASINLLKQSSATEVVAKVIKAKKGKAAKVPVSVTSTSLGGPVSGGKVVAKEGSKTVGSGTLKAGKVVLKLSKKLKVGKHKITVSYVGIPSVGGSSDKVVVKVVK